GGPSAGRRRWEAAGTTGADGVNPLGHGVLLLRPPVAHLTAGTEQPPAVVWWRAVRLASRRTVVAGGSPWPATASRAHRQARKVGVCPTFYTGGGSIMYYPQSG